MPAFSKPLDAPTPLSEADLQATAAILSQQTLESLPTSTALPSETPVVHTPSPTVTASPEVTATETANPALLTLTATLLALSGTDAATTTAAVTDSADISVTATLPAVEVSTTATIGTPQPLTHGTLPPNLPAGMITLFNKSHVEVYISLRCVTKDGYVTILEYPVKKNFKISAPAGQYTYIAWVGGRQFSGGFSLSPDGAKTITFYTDKIHITK
ncbi:hypothetical protein MASR2M66_33810 [Chloroflexota bacterium]